MEKLIAYIVLQSKLNTVTSMVLDNIETEDVPFIPSQIIRGKMIELLTMQYGIEITDRWSSRHRCKDKTCFICLIFGTGDMIRRLIIKDAKPEDNIKSCPWEFKVEGYRVIRKIPPGISFNIDFVYRIFEQNGDHGKRDCSNFKYILEGLTLMEENYLGKNGVRGSGRVSFSDLSIHIYSKTELNTIELELADGWALGNETERGVKNLVRTKSL
jgi:CRISPR/Cas system CSM-associated protein Csm3 (group 7 of RAMP superfamily)